METEMDNFIIVPTEMEEPEDIIEDFVVLALSCSSEEDLRDIFRMFFEEIVLIVEKQFDIEVALHMIERIKEVQKEINELRSLD